MRRTSRRIRRNSRRRTSLRRNGYTTQTEKLAQLLKGKYDPEVVKYSASTDRGSFGSRFAHERGLAITFTGSGTDGNVWLTLPQTSVKIDAQDAFVLIQKFISGIRLHA
jgi:hypothetical protein